LPWHFFPHPPQWFLLVSVSTQVLPHSEKPALQANPQLLAWQIAVELGPPGGQALSHMPQCSGSLVVSTQPPAHSMNGELQVKSQAPLQTGVALAGAVQTVSQSPQ
jgi:hypothetical protein